MKRLGLFILLISITLLMTSCSKVNKSNYKKIEIDSKLMEVVDRLGEPNDRDVLYDMTHSAYYWFDKDVNLEEAKELAAKGTKVYYILVITKPTNDGPVIIGKRSGNVYSDLNPGDVSVYA